MPRIGHGLPRRGAPRVDDGLEGTCSRREGRMIGRVAFQFPLQDFASDAAAAC